MPLIPSSALFCMCITNSRYIMCIESSAGVCIAEKTCDPDDGVEETFL